MQGFYASPRRGKPLAIGEPFPCTSTIASMAAAGEHVLITHRQQRWDLAAGQVFTFGRAESCTLCLDPADLGISRLAGSIEADAGVWWILNRSGARTVTAVDELGIPTLIALAGAWLSRARQRS